MFYAHVYKHVCNSIDPNIIMGEKECPLDKEM